MRFQRALDDALAAWVTGAKNLPEMLGAVLRVYDKDGVTLLGAQHRDWIQSLGHQELARLGDTVRLIAPGYLDTEAGRNAIAIYAALRHPVHSPSTTYLVPGALKAALGYEEQDADALEASGWITAPVRFAVLGKARARFSGTGDPAHLWIVHAWGVHLGDGGSAPMHRQADLRYVAGTDDYAERSARCKELMRVNAALITRAIEHVLETEQRGVLVMWNGIGLGAWLDRGVVGETQPLVDHWKELAQQAAEHFNAPDRERSPVLVWQPFYVDANPEACHTDAYLGTADRDVQINVTRNADPCGGFVVADVAEDSRPKGDERFMPGDRVVLVLNAWDDWSFIGNGGKSDPTLDGFIVIGCDGTTPSAITARPGSEAQRSALRDKPGVCWQAASTAYMHNVFFNPALLQDTARTLVADTAPVSPAFEEAAASALAAFNRSWLHRDAFPR